MFDRRNIRRIYLNITGKTKDFLLSDKSREFFVFLFFFFIAGGFWLLQTLNNDYEGCGTGSDTGVSDFYLFDYDYFEYCSVIWGGYL
jgi:hypothetical protein